MARGEETGAHPNRQVHRDRFSGAGDQLATPSNSTGWSEPTPGPAFASQGWPATTEEWEARGNGRSPVRADDVSLGEHQGWHYIKHRPEDRRL